MQYSQPINLHVLMGHAGSDAIDHLASNVQGIQLSQPIITAASPRLKTSLRHVDIHHHWLRQEAQTHNINLTYIPTSIQPADSLTKLLPRQRHENWVKLLRFNTFPTTPSPTQ